MPCGLPLSKTEQGQIVAYRHCGKSVRAISRQIGRSVGVVHKFLRSPTQYTAKKKRGINRKISQNTKRRLLRTASNAVSSASQMKTALGLQISVRRVQQILHATPHLKYRKMYQVPWMDDSHFEQRIKWAITHVAWKAEWSNVIFSDEKKFNLDGPDGLMHYWKDHRKKPLYFSRRAFDGGSLMVWGAICTNGKSKLAILDGKQTADSYVSTLNNFLVPLLGENQTESAIFQHDNASIHTAHLTKLWLLFRNIKTMDWPAHSPDLNPIENVWGLLARRVYANKCAFQSVNELKVALLHEWEKLDICIIQNLIQTMSARCCAVIKRDGRCI